MIHGGNAPHAAHFPTPDQNETLALLRAGGDDQLDRVSPWNLVDGKLLSAEGPIARHIIAHARQHLDSIRAAVGTG